MELKVTENTYCIHHFAATWHDSTPLDLQLNPLQKTLKFVRDRLSYIKHDLIKKKHE